MSDGPSVAATIAKAVVLLNERLTEGVAAVNSVADAVHGLTCAVDQHRRETVDAQRAAIAASLLGSASHPDVAFWMSGLGLGLSGMFPPKSGKTPSDALLEILETTLKREQK